MANNLITWSFQVQEQGFITRYGIAGMAYFKQYLPGGLEVPLLHPPKRIDPRLYFRAKAVFDKTPKTTV